MTREEEIAEMFKLFKSLPADAQNDYLAHLRAVVAEEGRKHK